MGFLFKVLRLMYDSTNFLLGQLKMRYYYIIYYIKHSQRGASDSVTDILWYPKCFRQELFARKTKINID